MPSTAAVVVERGELLMEPMAKEVCFLDRVVHYETTLVRADLHLQFKRAML
jgi:hypothetical protein